MLGKSLVAGTVLTLLAGGAVYYGTDAQGNISAKAGMDKLESLVSKKNAASDTRKTATDEATAAYKVEHPHEGHKDEGHEDGGHEDNSEKSSADIPSINSDPIDPKSAAMSGTLKEASLENEAEDSIELTDNSAPEAALEDADESSETPTRKWIDQYLKSESKTADNQAEAEAAAEIIEEDPDTDTDQISKDAEMEAQMEREMEAQMEAEIAAVLAQEEALEKELAQMMAEMEAHETLEQVDVEVEIAPEGESPEDESHEKTEAETTEIELFTDEEILEAEAKGFESRAKEIENIWISKDEEKLSDAEVKTLHDVLKDKSEITTTETETIDLGDGKVMKIVKVTRAHDDDEAHAEKKIKIKIMRDDDLKDVTESELKHEVIDTDGGKKIKIRKNKKAHITAKHTQADHDKNCDKDEKMSTKADVSSTAKIVMAQAEKISMSELRDRAYLDLVSYALDNGNKAVANKAMSKIEQVELRDTARNRMAVSYAKAGDAEKAFAILEDIEVEALRDVMRLQVIEALIVPEAPAPAMQDTP